MDCPLFYSSGCCSFIYDVCVGNFLSSCINVFATQMFLHVLNMRKTVVIFSTHFVTVCAVLYFREFCRFRISVLTYSAIPKTDTQQIPVTRTTKYLS